MSDQDAARGAAQLRAQRIPDLPFDRLLLDWRGARDRTEAYARALGIDPPEASTLARRALEQAVSGRGASVDPGPFWPPVRVLRVTSGGRARRHGRCRWSDPRLVSPAAVW